MGLIVSEAWGNFKENMRDVDRLLSIHRDISGDKRGRKYGVEVLNKASIILLTACWEAYVEELCQRGFEFLLTKITDATQYPLQVRLNIARRIKKDKDDRSVWHIAGDGWRRELREYCNDRIRTV